MASTIETPLARVARRQHGVITGRQARDIGVSKQQIKQRVDSGMWRRVDRATFVIASHPSTWKQRVMAAVLSESNAVAGKRTSAALHQFDGFGNGSVHLDVPLGANTRSRLATIHRSSFIRRTTVDFIPTNDAAVTWMDLTEELTKHAAHKALESGLRNGSLTMSRLQNELVRRARSRRPGIGMVRSLLEPLSDDYIPSASELERMLYEGFDDRRRFGELVRQPHLPWRPETNECLDGLLPRGNIILEGDGRCWHNQLQDFDRDRRRDREAAVHGLIPMRFTWIDLTAHLPECQEQVESVQRRASEIHSFAS